MDAMEKKVRNGNKYLGTLLNAVAMYELKTVILNDVRDCISTFMNKTNYSFCIFGNV